MQLVGKQNISFTDNSGQLIEGVKLHFIGADDRVIGQAALTQFIKKHILVTIRHFSWNLENLIFSMAVIIQFNEFYKVDIMAAKYLKKRKLFEIAKYVFDDTSLELSRSEYIFYRGTEWLILYTDIFVFALCAENGGNYLTAETYCYDDDGKRKLVHREVLNGFGRHAINVVQNIF